MKPKPTPSLAVPTETSAQVDRTRLAWFANKKQDLLAPADAIVNLSDILIKDARERGQEDLAHDLEQIHASAKRLLALARQMLDPATLPAGQDDVAQRARHDLRSPLTHIIGLCEIWLEDAADLLLDGFVSDLKSIHEHGKQLLVSIDALLGLGALHVETRKRAGSVGGGGTPLETDSNDVELDSESSQLEVNISDLIQSMKPRANAKAIETGMVLVVDDNEINRDILRRRLTRDGHLVSLAENGRQALDMLREHPFDLVLLDIIMPELNGFQVLEQMKADERLRHIPVIMISAFSEMDGVIRCITAGAEDYLAKPFNPILLQARISACLEKKRLRDREVLHLEEIKKERLRADELLHVILPRSIVTELKATNTVRPRRFDPVAVLFCDIVGFTPYCDRSQPEQVVTYLQQLIETWEEIAVRNRVEKIKTIGDAFMAASGLLEKTEEHPVLHCVRCGLEMIAACQSLPTEWNLRVGIHVGPVVAGVIGKRQYLFDLWGDTVNTAARMESHGVPGSVVLSGPAWDAIASYCRGKSLGIVSIKGKPPMEMIRLDGLLG